MTHDKNAAAPAATQLAVKQQTANQKHSNLFYISNSLFQNKWLKQQRCQWMEARKTSYRKKRKMRYLRKLAALKADVTIDLLSDDEVEITSSQVQQPEQLVRPTQFQLIPNDANTMQISQVPNITLIPVHKMQTTAALPKALKKNKRKTRPRKRLPTPLDCMESIVLTDDDVEVDMEVINTTLPEPIVAPEPHAPTGKIPTPLFTQVDEEVSVSLVPRSKPSGTCSTHNNAKAADTLFPMLPDETTVHTVIANRIYELSLSKLREGLATCGIPEFADEQQRLSAKSRRKTTYAPPIATPPPAPVSLKLSSDLSISLISDDEPEDDTIMLGQLSPSLKIRTMHAAEMQHRQELHQQPLPLISGEVTTLQKPRKRKLG